MRERRFPATVATAAEAVSWALAEAVGAGLPEERGFDLELSVEEVVVNVCLYAYGGREGDVLLRVGRSGDGLLVEVEDGGPSFDPRSVPPPDLSAPLEQRAIGGLGLHLVRNFTDGFDWRREGERNVVTLVFADRRPAGDAPGEAP